MSGDVSVGSLSQIPVDLPFSNILEDLDVAVQGEGRERKLFDIAYDGPRAWCSYSW